MTFDYINGDPCSKCRYAKLLEENQVNGMFERRFGCVNTKRREELISEAVKLLESNDTESLIRAANALNAAADMDCQMRDKGYYDCSPSPLIPSCYE